MKTFKFLSNFLDDTLNSIPMYKTVLYSLLFIISVVFLESFLGIVSFSLQSLIVSILITTIICVLANFIFCKIYRLPFQYESSLITSLIIFLILAPADDFFAVVSIAIASFAAIASKYILNFRNTHIFNPAAFGVFTVTFLGYFFTPLATAFWWVGSLYLLPIVLFTSLLVVHKTRKMFLFVIAALLNFIGVILLSIFLKINPLDILYSTFIAGPFLFMFAFMLTEPHTMARNKFQQILYITLIFMLPVSFQIMTLPTIAPELAILIGNIFTFIVSKRQRLILKLNEIKKMNENTFEYIFENKNKIKFVAGEFLEWYLPHKNPDFRGERRYFTISSVPNETEIAFATKFPPANESSFKKALKEMKVGEKIFATQLGGDFLLNNNTKRNIIMIAGGIGITPFASQLRDLANKTKNIRTDLSIALFYCVNTLEDIVYKDLLNEAATRLGVKVVYVVSNLVSPNPAENQYYESGYMSKDILKKYTQNLHNDYYISGPNKMVQMVEKIISENKSKDQKIHTDFFPGF